MGDPIQRAEERIQWAEEEKAEEEKRRNMEHDALIQLEALHKYWRHRYWQHKGDESEFLEFVAHAVYHEEKFLPEWPRADEWTLPSVTEDRPAMTRSQRHIVKRNGSAATNEITQWAYVWSESPQKRWGTWPDVFCDDPQEWEQWGNAEVPLKHGKCPGSDDLRCSSQKQPRQMWLPRPWCPERHLAITCLAKYPAPCRFRREGMERFWWMLVVVIEVPVEVVQAVCECIMPGDEFDQDHAAVAAAVAAADDQDPYDDDDVDGDYDDDYDDDVYDDDDYDDDDDDDDDYDDDEYEVGRRFRV